MKRSVFLYAFALAVLAVLAAASVWEGSAVAAAQGQLPDSGFYIATNSFPKNTVVDMKNLENDKTVRVVVSGALDSPGLLATVSKEAADALGLSPKAVTRVRVSMPSDTVAFARYTEGAAESTDPDRNPKLAANAALPPAASGADASGKSGFVRAAAGAPASAAGAAGSGGSAAAFAAPAATAVPAIAVIAAGGSDKPEESKKTEAAPVEIPENYAPAIASDPSEAVPAEASAAANAPAAEAVESAEAPEAPEGASAGAVLVASEKPAEGVAETPAPEAAEAPASDTAIAAAPADAGVAPPEAPAAEAAPAAESAAPAVAPVAAVAVSETPAAKEDEAEAAPAAESSAPETVVVALVPAEARPPQAPAAEAPSASAALPAAVPVVAPVPAAVQTAPAELAPAQAAPEVAPSGAPVFPVPTVKTLDNGKYYVQVGSYAKGETVTAMLKKIDPKYPAIVQVVEGKNPVYRVLIGPVSQGECGALALKVKRAGFPDAFARKGS